MVFFDWIPVFFDDNNLSESTPILLDKENGIVFSVFSENTIENPSSTSTSTSGTSSNSWKRRVDLDFCLYNIVIFVCSLVHSFAQWVKSRAKIPKKKIN
jgi:hypothetical protein